jgi:SNF2 family DNA or RNA helicase
MSLFDYITKTAAGEPKEEKKAHGTGIPSMKDWFKPYPHQKKAIDRLFSNKGKMILAHEMGTGKTVTSIYGFEKLRHEGKAKKAIVVVPSGLRANFAKEGVEKFTNSSFQVVGSQSEKRNDGQYVRPGGEKDTDYTIISYAQFRRDPNGFMDRTGADTIIFDEFHKTRNEQAGTFKAALEARKKAVNVMGLTASMINNSPSEIATLLTITEGKRDMSPKQFKRRYMQTVGFTKGFSGGKKKVVGFKNVEDLKSRTQSKIDLVETGDLKGKTMPKKNLKNVDVEMSPDQFKLYQLSLNKLGPLKERITRRDPNITVKDARNLFGQITQARQLSNSIHTGRKDVTPKQAAELSPKVKKVLEDTVQHLSTKPDHKVVLYSNLVRGGVDVLSAGLRSRGISHAVFVGKGTEIGGEKITGIVRQKGVQDYKDGKKKVIILSGAGAEGLNLKNSTAFFSLDGHFNPQRVLQAEARARRLGGQQHRAVENRAVDVRRYRSVVPKASRPGFFGKLIGRKAEQTTDEWMYNVAGNKFQTQTKFYSTFKTPAKHLYKYRDQHGNIRYVYPKRKKPGLFSRLFGSKSSKPASGNGAQKSQGFKQPEKV